MHVERVLILGLMLFFRYHSSKSTKSVCQVYPHQYLSQFVSLTIHRSHCNRRLLLCFFGVSGTHTARKVPHVVWTRVHLLDSFKDLNHEKGHSPTMLRLVDILGCLH